MTSRVPVARPPFCERPSGRARMRASSTSGLLAEPPDVGPTLEPSRLTVSGSLEEKRFTHAADRAPSAAGSGVLGAESSGAPTRSGHPRSVEPGLDPSASEHLLPISSLCPRHG